MAATEVFEMSPKELASYLPVCIEEGEPVMIWGTPGCGKSEIVAQAAAAMGRGLIDERLSSRDPVDLRGLPYSDTDRFGNKVMKFSRPPFFPEDPDSNDVLFFDELSTVPLGTQVAALQLFLDKRIGDHILPKRVGMVAAGNASTHRTGCKDLPMALNNRVNHVYLKTDANDWIEWAMNSGHDDPEVIGFLSFNNAYLNMFDPKNPDPAQMTPRVWIKFMKMKNKVPKDLQQHCLAGYGGKGLAVEYFAQREAAGNLPHPDDILQGKVTTWNPPTVCSQFYTTVACNSKLKTYQDSVGKKVGGSTFTLAEWDTMVNNFLSFITNNISPEIGMMAVTQGVRTLKLLYNFDRHHKYTAFYEKNKRIFRI